MSSQPRRTSILKSPGPVNYNPRNSTWEKINLVESNPKKSTGTNPDLRNASQKNNSQSSGPETSACKDSICRDAADGLSAGTNPTKNGHVPEILVQRKAGHESRKGSTLKEPVLKFSARRNTIAMDITQVNSARKNTGAVPKRSLPKERANYAQKGATRKTTNRAGSTAKKDSVRRDSVKKDFLRLDTGRKESTRRDTDRKESTRRDTDRKEPTRRDTDRKEPTRRDTDRKETTRRDTDRKEPTRRDIDRKEPTRRDTDRKDPIRRDTAKKDTTRKDTARKESTRRETDRKDSTRRDTAKKSSTRKDTARKESTPRDSVKKQSLRKDSAKQEPNSKFSTPGDPAKKDSARKDSGPGEPQPTRLGDSVRWSSVCREAALERSKGRGRTSPACEEDAARSAKKRRVSDWLLDQEGCGLQGEGDTPRERGEFVIPTLDEDGRGSRSDSGTTTEREKKKQTARAACQLPHRLDRDVLFDSRSEFNGLLCLYKFLPADDPRRKEIPDCLKRFLNPPDLCFDPSLIERLRSKPAEPPQFYELSSACYFIKKGGYPCKKQAPKRKEEGEACCPISSPVTNFY